MIEPVSRSRPSARVVRRSARHRVIATLAIVIVATLAPAGVLAADRSPAPDRSGDVTVLPERTPERGIAANPVPAGTIGVQSSIGYFYGDGSVAVVGTVYNNTSLRRRAIRIEVTYFNAAAARVGEIEDNVILDSVARGSLGPFLLIDEAPPGPQCPADNPPTNCVKTYRIRVVSSLAVTKPAVGVLKVLDSTSTVVGDVRRFEGTIQNAASVAVADVTVTVTAYKANGDVLDVTWNVPSGWLRSGATVPYRLDIAVSDDPDLVYHHGRVVADAFRSGSTSAYVTSWSNYFDDIAKDPFRNDILWLAEAGITGGCGPGKYCPTATVRRDQMASFLSRALELTGTAPDRFTDDEGNTHEASINRIAAAGITGGCGGGKYCPAANVTRSQMAAFLRRAFQ